MRIHIGNLGDVFIEEKHKSIEYTTEFWRGFMLTTSSRAEEHRCDICGGKTPAERGKGITNALRVASWIDITRPEGDARRYAHPECLEKVHTQPREWPAGLSYHPRRDTPERELQRRAISA